MPPFGAGDWTVTGNETFADRSIILAGDLLITPGASLTISNATLTVFSPSPDEHGIRVMDGGTLRVQNGSMVNAFDYAFDFDLDAGAIAEFSNSTFIACGRWYDEVNLQIVGGILSRTHLLTVDNCTFAGSHIALTTYAPARFSGTTFTTNYIGVIAIRTALSFTDCSFTGNTFVGVWPYRSVAGFTNCTFINNSLGISSDESTCDVLGCYFAQNTGNGLWASSMEHQFGGPSNFLVEDCLFEDNAIGIGHFGEVGSNQLHIVNCDFQNNPLALDWENGGFTGNPPHGATTWNVTRPCLAQNNRFLFNGNIDVRSGGVLDFAGSNLTFDSDSAGESGLLVQGGGLAEFSNGSLLRAHWGSQPYYLRCLPGSAFRMDDTVLRDCGWDQLSPPDAGPFFEGAEARIGSSAIDYCTVPLQFFNMSGVAVHETGVRGDYSAIHLYNSTAAFVNGTLEPVYGPSVWLENASALECINSTVNREIVRFDDNQSRLNLSWYLDVRARWGDGAPVEGARLSVSDLTGAEVAREELGPDGRLRGLILREASLGLQETQDFTPHAVNCSIGAVHNRTVQVMDQSRLLDIVLEDREAPSVTIAFPAPDAFLSSGTVVVNGTASDNLGVEKVELVIDGFRRVFPKSAGGPFQPVAWWDAELALLEGPHTVEARAFDRAGNFGSALVSFTVDRSSPRVRIASPPDGHLTNLSLLSVFGYMEPGCRVLLGGSEVRTERDTFGGTVVLGEGQNLVTATAIDRAGNANTSTVRVRLDTRPPALEVLWPPDGLRTNIPMVPVNGTMEPGAGVYVNGRPVALTGEIGTFRTAVALPRETNLIVVDAVDPAGNHNLTVRTVTLDTRPPLLEIESPSEGLLTNRTDGWLSGVTEGGALLAVDGCLTRVPGEPGSRAAFAVPLALSEGTNTIFVSAMDEAGNLNRSVRHVVVDTQPPAILISSPENGSGTGRFSVFVIGETEPGATLTIDDRNVPVGQTGSFSLEVRLSSGLNRFTVRATDAAGNTNETAVEVRRLATPGDEILPVPSGPDWPFLGFILVAACASVLEGWWASRRMARRRGGPV